MTTSNEVEVTFKVPKDRTVTFRGKPVADGDKLSVSLRQKQRLAERGLITAQPKAETKG